MSRLYGMGARGARCFSTKGGKGTVGFVGVGNMGGHMAANLLKAGHKVVAFDIMPANLATVLAKGATSASSLQQLAEQCDTIVTMLPSSPHVKSAYCDPVTGMLKKVRPGTLLIDSSTIDPSSSREVADAAKKAGAQMVDAPVSGGVGGAEAGTLTFMVGGSQDGFNAAKPILERMGKNIVHCGGNGTGQVAKVCNNLVLGISMAGVSEGMNLGVKLGMDPVKLAGIFNTSTARCWSSDTYNPCPGVMPNVPASKGYAGGFGVDLMKKDLGLAITAAKDSKAKVPLGELTNSIYETISKEGGGKKDFSYVYKYLNDQK